MLTARATRRGAAAVLLVVVSSMVAHPVATHLRAASLLVRFASPEHPGALGRFSAHSVMTKDASFEGPHGRIKARLYLPDGATDVPGIVFAHGVHHAGIEEPRLMRFAEAFARSGVAVLTPEVAELCDYRIDPRSIDTIGASAGELRRALRRKAVGVMGMSFSGGLALLAAEDARFKSDVAFVVAVGAHDDLTRVSRFFVTDTIEGPDGHPEPMKAHEYGAMVLIYAHVERFFPEADVTAAREALRAWLWEDREAARAKLASLSPASKEKMERLFSSQFGPLRDEVLADVAKNEAEATRVSPHGHLQNLAAPVFLIHGAGDTVIPPSETSWLSRDVPQPLVRDVLISAAVRHVELEDGDAQMEKLRLVHFMADVLAEAEREPRESP